MIKKFEHLSMYVQGHMVWPLRIIFLMFAGYMAAEMYEIVNTGIAPYRNSPDAIRGEDPFRFWSKFTEKLVTGLFFIILAIQVKDKEDME